MPMRGPRGLFVFLLLAVAAASGAAPAPATPFVPLKVGARWDFRLSGEDRFAVGDESQIFKLTGTMIEEVIAASTRAGAPKGAFDLESTTTRTESESGSEWTEVGIEIIAETATGLFVHAKQEDDPDTGRPVWTDYRPPLQVLALPLTVGKKWKVGTFDEDGLHGTGNAEVVAIETVTVPAGTFKDCIKVVIKSSLAGETEMMGAPVTLQNGTTTTTEWFAPGTGRVKRTSRSTADLIAAELPPVTQTTTKTEVLTKFTPGK